MYTSKPPVLNIDSHSYKDAILLRLFSFDIECVPSPDEADRFNFEKLGPIFQIGAVSTDVLMNLNEGNVSIVDKQRFLITIGQCETGIPETVTFQVYDQSNSSEPEASGKASNATELTLLMGFRYLLKSLDPDIITGHNIVKFDFPYIKHRLKYQLGGFTCSEDAM